jgi:hypothetical protein
MASEASKYTNYARECVRLAGHASTADQRDRLLDLAKVWMNSAMDEEEIAALKHRPTKSDSASVGDVSPKDTSG